MDAKNKSGLGANQNRSNQNKLQANHTFHIALAQRVSATPSANAGAIEQAFVRAIFGGSRHE